MLTDEELSRADFDARAFVESLHPDGNIQSNFTFLKFLDNLDNLIELLETKLEQNTIFFQRQMEAVSIEQVQSSLKDASLVAGIQSEALKVSINKYSERKNETDEKIIKIVKLSQESHTLTSAITNTRQLQMMSKEYVLEMPYRYFLRFQSRTLRRTKS